MNKAFPLFPYLADCKIQRPAELLVCFVLGKPYLARKIATAILSTVWMLVIEIFWNVQRVPAEKTSKVRLNQLDQKNSISITMG